MPAVELPAEDTSARTARRLVAATLEDWELADLVDTAVLLTSELVTNAVVHARSDVRLEVERCGFGLRVAVADQSLRELRPAPRESEAVSGRGLQLVGALADRWGVEEGDDGKLVWFELGTAPDVAEPVAEDEAPSSPEVFARLAAGPTAVVLVDPATATVTMANDAALELAGSPTLPVSVADWVAGVHLCGADGRLLASAGAPEARVARGETVAGESVSVRSLEGDVDGGGEVRPPAVLWATGEVLSSADGTVGLVVYTVVQALDGNRPLGELQARLVVASARAFAISDPRLPDNPLVYVNAAFEQMTGYPPDESLGRNCRFLQGDATDPVAVAELRLAVAERRAHTATVLNHRRDGSVFWNEITLLPVAGVDGAVAHFVGMQSDVTARVLALAEAENALAQAESASRKAESIQSRLGLLAEATTLLTATLDVDATCTGLARLVVPYLADACAIDLIAEDGRLVRRAARHVDPGKTDLVRGLAPDEVSGAEATILAGALESSILLPELADEVLVEAVGDPGRVAGYRALGIRSLMVVPLAARGRSLGSLTMVTTSGSTRVLEPADLILAEDLARRAAQALDNARLYRAEQRVAEVLQRSMLPDRLPSVPGVAFASRYVAGSDVADVGGDWYDVIPLRDGGLGLVVGDVMGHDLAAAALMGQLRSYVRAYAIDSSSPAEVLDRVDDLVRHLDMPAFASVLYGVFEPRSGLLRWCRGGHPPPLVIDAGGRARFLEGGGSVLVGVGIDGTGDFVEDEVVLSPGSTLLLYTDGLIERRTASLDEGMARLADAASAAVHLPLETACDAILNELHARVSEDDVALLALRLPLLT